MKFKDTIDVIFQNNKALLDEVEVKELIEFMYNGFEQYANQRVIKELEKVKGLIKEEWNKGERLTEGDLDIRIKELKQ